MSLKYSWPLIHSLPKESLSPSVPNLNKAQTQIFPSWRTRGSRRWNGGQKWSCNTAAKLKMHVPLDPTQFWTKKSIVVVHVCHGKCSYFPFVLEFLLFLEQHQADSYLSFSIIILFSRSFNHFYLSFRPYSQVSKSLAWPSYVMQICFLNAPSYATVFTNLGVGGRVEVGVGMRFHCG